MTTTITEKEYDAICFAINQVEIEVEAASDESYLNEANDALSHLYRVCEKYKKARKKATEFQFVRAEVARRNRNRGLRPRDIDKLTRQVIKRMQ